MQPSDLRRLEVWRAAGVYAQFRREIDAAVRAEPEETSEGMRILFNTYHHRYLTSPTGAQPSCASILQEMLESVPPRRPGVVLFRRVQAHFARQESRVANYDPSRFLFALREAIDSMRDTVELNPRVHFLHPLGLPHARECQRDLDETLQRLRTLSDRSHIRRWPRAIRPNVLFDEPEQDAWTWARALEAVVAAAHCPTIVRRLQQVLVFARELAVDETPSTFLDRRAIDLETMMEREIRSYQFRRRTGPRPESISRRELRAIELRERRLRRRRS